MPEIIDLVLHHTGRIMAEILAGAKDEKLWPREEKLQTLNAFVRFLNEIDPAELEGHNLHLNVTRGLVDKVANFLGKDNGWVSQVIHKELPEAYAWDLEIEDVIQLKMPPEIPETVLNAFTVSKHETTQIIQRDRRYEFRVLAELVASWNKEDASTKEARNSTCEKLYRAASPLIKYMTHREKTLDEISEELNRQNFGRSLNDGRPILWDISFLIRGAVLTKDRLPISSFPKAEVPSFREKVIAYLKHENVGG